METRLKKIIGFSSIFILCTAVIGASINHSISIRNTLNMDTVDIELNELENSEDGLVKFQPIEYISPAQQISYIPQIVNKGIDCYVRAKISIDDQFLNAEGIESKWVTCKDGYLYYTDVLKEDESINIFDIIKVNENIDSSSELQKCNITVKVDAIQSRNFTPDFSSDMPFGSHEIQDTVRSRDFSRGDVS